MFKCPSVKCDVCLNVTAFGRCLPSLAWLWRSREGSDVADSGAADAEVSADWGGTELATWWLFHQTLCVGRKCELMSEIATWPHQAIVTVLKTVFKDRFTIFLSVVRCPYKHLKQKMFGPKNSFKVMEIHWSKCILVQLYFAGFNRSVPTGH